MFPRGMKGRKWKKKREGVQEKEKKEPTGGEEVDGGCNLDKVAICNGD